MDFRSRISGRLPVDRMPSLNPSGLYIHVPFCIRKCLYCNFYVVPLGTGPLPKRMQDFRTLKHRAFLRALGEELHSLPDSFAPKTIYIGGGTPTELPLQDLEQLFHHLKSAVDLSQVEEISCEANPGTLDAEMAGLLASQGVNRVSVGVQSFDDPTLELLGRIHNAEEAQQAFELLKDAGIPNISLDLLFGLPTNRDTVEVNLDQLTKLQPQHVSWYSLEYEAGTAFTELLERGDLVSPSEERMEAEYQSICSGLHELGFEQYELFSFTRPGFACQHNLNYWQGGEYHACGPSAHRHVKGTRSANAADLDRYVEGSVSTEQGEHLSPDAKARERLMTGLRMTRGMDVHQFEAQTGYTPAALMRASYRAWTDAGWLEEQEGFLRLRREAYLISDSLFREFI